MAATDISLPLKRLAEEVGSLQDLPKEALDWFQGHRIEPRAVMLAHDSEGKTKELYWLITEHTGSNDTSFRVFFDERKDRFGRECLLENDVPLVLGVYPTLFSVLEDIL